MEYYQVFLKVILKEIQRFQLNTEIYSTHVNQLTASLDGNFDVPYNRCAYMCKYALNCIYFFKDCVNLFLLDCNDARDMLSQLKHVEVNVCSLSIGPGLDYLAFVLAILENDPLPPKFTGATVISKHGAWRNTIKFMMEVFQEQGFLFKVEQSKLNYNNVKVFQADLFKSYTEKRTIVSLDNAHVVLMMKTLNVSASGTNQEGPILKMLMELISSLKSDTVIFCIDTKPSLALLSQALSNFSGKFLYGPIYRSIKLPVDFNEVEGFHPIAHNRGAFFVWQKLSSFPSMMNLSTSLSMTPVGTVYKSNMTGSHDSDISSLSTSIKDENDSENASWIELKTLWQSSSPATKELLKKLMLSDAENLELIGDTHFQLEKVDVKKNEHLNIASTELLEVAEVLTSNCEKSMLTTSNNLGSAYEYSCMTNSSVDSSYFETVNSLSPSETFNSVNNLIDENISSHSEIEVMSPVSATMKSNTCDVPVKIEVNSEDTNILIRDDAQISPYKERTAYELESNPTASKMLTEQVNHLINVSLSAHVKNDSIKTMDHSEDTIGKGVAAISSREKSIQADSCESLSSTSIKELTDRIRSLVSSLESISQQNGPPDIKISKETPNNSHCQHHFAPNTYIHNNMPSCSKHSHNYGSTEKNNLFSYTCAVKKKSFECLLDCNSRWHCCHNICNAMKLHCCSMICHLQHVPTCNFLCEKMSCKENQEIPTSTNIVIPLQNISEEALLKIVSLLK